ncbi:MAG: DUF424 family protein [Candidatus Diapherotrites archaeon]|nr:DUF424 family protein [Candidatus Diapherotrites archaeon]
MHGRDKLLAACDADLLGKELDGFTVSERFYGSEKVTEEEFGKMLDECTIANLTGETVINIAKKKGLVREGGVTDVGGVPHAQIVRML